MSMIYTHTPNQLELTKGDCNSYLCSLKDGYCTVNIGQKGIITLYAFENLKMQFSL